MGVVLSTLSFNRKNRRGDVPVDDVTKSPLIISSCRRLPKMNSEDSPSITNEPSMPSSIIETTGLSQQDNINQQHNVIDITTQLKIPKRAWSAYHLFHFSDTLKSDTIINSSNMIKSPRIRPKIKEISEEEDEEEDDDDEEDEPVEMEQLIAMMQNHKVSDETSSFSFSFGTGNNNTAIPAPPPPPPSPSSQSSSRSNWSPSPEFKFSFSANIPQKTHTHEQQDQDLDYYRRNQHQQNLNQSDHHNPMAHRKILPLPKPRRKKPSDSGNESINSTHNTKIFNIPAVDQRTENNTDQRDNSKKLKSSPSGHGIAQHPVVDNKRKERNWKDPFGTTAEVAEFSNHGFYALEKKKSTTVRYSSPLKKEVTPTQSPHTSPPSTPPATATTTTSDTSTTTKSSSRSATIAAAAVLSTTIAIKKQAPKKKGAKMPLGSSSQSTYTKKTSNIPTTKKKGTQRKRVNKEEIAPGGFLSSDITLFENPISHEDWICLFCQYDILMHGFEDAKKKNNFYRRKREKKRTKEAESTRLGGDASESDQDNHPL